MSIIKSKRYIKKVALIGDSAVGKTSLIRRFVIDVFDDKYIATVGAKVSKRDLEYKLSDKTVYLTLMLWDILGQKDYKKMRTQGLTGAHGVMLVTDLNRPETVQSVQDFWLPEIAEIVPNSPVLFVGNKADLVKESAPTVRLLKEISRKTKMPIVLSSAKTGENVSDTFRKIGELMLESELFDKKAAEPTPESMAQAIDDVVSDFCEQYGDTFRAMEIVEREFTRAKVDVNAPNKDALLMAIEYLSDIERDVHGRDVSEVNKLRRWKMIDEAR
ncbi:MAG: GTP-binding protein [Candidatus Thermoplasmatota archaeon]|nr:GTP-binding protein [Candidatus Thermoplasmatota archaeon]